MTAKEAIEYIENYTWSTSRLGLERTQELLRLMGDPQKKLRFVHVAGSNGKGSTCAMLESILRKAGYRTGMYTSPYIQEFCERIQICGENIPGGRLAEITERVQPLADSMEDHPSQFELITAIGMLYFLEEAVDIVILEVGMGGLLDSTNVIEAPEAAVITNIGLEHTEYLGSTLEEIAFNKGGIIKTGCSCVCYDGAPEVTEVIRSICADRQVPLKVCDFSRIRSISSGLLGQSFEYKGKEYEIGLLGRHQLFNSAVVLETVDVLRERGWRITEDAVSSGLAGAKWPARLEVFSTEPLFILDGGHNPQCAEALAESLREMMPGRKHVFLMGVLADKDYETMVDILEPAASEFICLTPVSSRALSGEDFAEYLRGRGIKAESCAGIRDGILKSLEHAGKDGSVISCGSLYLAGAVRTEMQRQETALNC